MRIVPILSMLLATFVLSAQNGMEQQIDSLENKLKQAKADTTKVNIMCLLTRAYGGIDSVKTFKMGQGAIDLSKKIDYLKGTTDAHIAIAGGYLDYYDIDKAEYFYKKGTQYAEELIAKDSSKANLKLWIRGYFNLGVAYGYRGDIEKEIRYYKKTLPLAQKLNDTLFIAITNTNLGIKYIDLGRYEQAVKSFAKSKKQYESLGNPDDIIFDRLNYSFLLYKFDSLPKMKLVLNQAKKRLDKVPNHINWQLYYSKLGMYLSGIGEHGMAIMAYDKASGLLQKNKMTGLYYDLYLKYTETYEQAKNFEMAKEYMKKNLDMAKNAGSKENQRTPSFKLSEYEARAGNYQNAYDHLKNYVTITDSLQRQEITQQIKHLELEYDTAKREKEILALQNEKNETALSLEQKRSQTFLMGTAISALAFLLLMGYLFYRKKLRNALEKERKRKTEVELLKQEQQNKIFFAMIEGQEKERKRLAIDLHDGLGGRLSGISLNLSKLNKDQPKQYPKKQLRKMMKDLDDSLSELRSIARNMMPETLVKFGLQAALKDYCSSMNNSDSKVSLQFYGSDKGISLNQQVTMYRIMQELINNAVKHADASEVLVQYMRETNIVDITVEDNGTGVAEEVLENKDSGIGMGLSNLRTRVAYLNGVLDFHSEKKEGTTVNIHINIDAA